MYSIERIKINMMIEQVDDIEVNATQIFVTALFFSTLIVVVFRETYLRVRRYALEALMKVMSEGRSLTQKIYEEQWLIITIDGKSVIVPYDRDLIMTNCSVTLTDGSNVKLWKGFDINRLDIPKHISDDEDDDSDSDENIDFDE